MARPGHSSLGSSSAIPERGSSGLCTPILADTEAAIHRLFAALPQVDVITVRVLDRVAETVIISGTVARAAALNQDERNRDEGLSIGMRLLYLGLTYHSGRRAV